MKRVAFNQFIGTRRIKRQHGRCVLVPKVVSFFFFFFLIHGTRPLPPSPFSTLVSFIGENNFIKNSGLSSWKTRVAHPANDARMETLQIDAIKTPSSRNRRFPSPRIRIRSIFQTETRKINGEIFRGIFRSIDFPKKRFVKKNLVK